ncbi:hypothetical protein NIIDMKKI_40130 [Mycobacterium kansasii]|uniref:Uncharacterized protein n=1 Tax=Mycobacterium kansasii TaxID=1768 RepID=A0A7G1ID06_MYCKA|nr:hypothetical protein NIIDMKKI_40130 [Mycobacterium kansasii]
MQRQGGPVPDYQRFRNENHQCNTTATDQSKHHRQPRPAPKNDSGAGQHGERRHPNRTARSGDHLQRHGQPQVAMGRKPFGSRLVDPRYAVTLEDVIEHFGEADRQYRDHRSADEQRDTGDLGHRQSTSQRPSLAPARLRSQATTRPITETLHARAHSPRIGVSFPAIHDAAATSSARHATVAALTRPKPGVPGPDGWLMF